MASHFGATVHPYTSSLSEGFFIPSSGSSCSRHRHPRSAVKRPAQRSVRREEPHHGAGTLSILVDGLRAVRAPGSDPSLDPSSGSWPTSVSKMVMVPGGLTTF